MGSYGTEPKNRKRKIIWFNPPYNKSVTTNVGNFFLKLIDKHFPKHHKYRQLFNRNTIKVSYSCLPNMKSKINQRNKRVLQDKNDPSTPNGRTCNCPKNITCPLNGICLDKDLLYTGNLTSDLPGYKMKEYKGISCYIVGHEGCKGICSTTWKLRYANHKKSFNHEVYETDSELAMEVWRIKRKQGQYEIKWPKVP